MYIRENLWSFNTRDLMRASSCDHCTMIAVARTLGESGVLAKLKPYEDEILEAKRLGEDTSLAQKYGILFEDALIKELLSSAGEEVVNADDVVSHRYEAFTEMATEEASAAGDKNALV